MEFLDWWFDHPLRLLLTIFGVIGLIVGGGVLWASTHPDPPPPTQPRDNGGGELERFRDEEHHVTCYRYRYGMSVDKPMSCVADSVPLPSCSAVPR